MVFDDEFFKNLPEGNPHSMLAICEKSSSYINNIPRFAKAHEDDLLEILAVLTEAATRYGYKVNLPAPSSHLNDLVIGIKGVITSLPVKIQSDLRKNKYAALQSQFSSKFPNAFAYEFTEGDLKRIQQLINELREQVSKSSQFEEEHRQRVLKRLERLQSELHKKMSDLDRIWGLVGDAGVALGKLGKDAKPIVDRIRELADIAWKVQARTEQLASDAPFPALENKAKKADTE